MIEKTERPPIEIADIHNVIVLRPKGKLDNSLSQIVEKKVIDYMHANRINILLNLQDVIYINSAGLRMLLSLKKQIKALDGQLIVTNLSREVMEIIKICGFDHILNISPSEEEALLQFQ